ncbi:MAG: hypothetical protein DWI24_03370 [Planctomycetota bacterium]|nr:MAG: hypothetical protein DWI24_03370 [Planctomycetota bacterium]
MKSRRRKDRAFFFIHLAQSPPRFFFFEIGGMPPYTDLTINLAAGGIEHFAVNSPWPGLDLADPLLK